MVDQAREGVDASPEQNIFAIPCEDEAVLEEEDRALPQPAPPVPESKAADVSGRGAPCASCRFFRPLPTFYDGVAGVRLCWARRPVWDFSCFARREENRYEAGHEL
ncbi:MAG: hypothetical protein ACP59X_12195 [Solidesulfovibrio sp. DCME]|uniref:hypothetical protein n=1 Tax=Solidesulfovibrio sp. DCME TaxID=3447380 RepID=UPI003D0AB642